MQTQIDPVNDPRIAQLYSLAKDEVFRESFFIWVQESGIILDGNPFSFQGHEYLKEIYQDLPNIYDLTLKKAAQMGLSTLEILNAMHGCKNGRYPHGLLYLLPSKTDVTEFSKSKAQGIIDQNDQLRSWITDTDAANIKKIGDAWLYFRGMKSRIGLKCHDDQTEVLTNGGWKFFKDVTKDDEVATRSPTGCFMWQQVTDIAHIQYEGKMFHFKANGLDFCITPNHRLLLTDHDNENEEWIDTAENILPKLNSHLAVVRTCKSWHPKIPELIERNGTRWGQIKITGNRINSRWEPRHPDRLINLRDWVAFLGLYVAEGCCSGVMSGELKPKPGKGRVFITQKETSPNFKTIKALLERLPFNWKRNRDNFYVSDAELAKILILRGNKYTKTLPNWVVNLPREYLEVLWKFAVMGDGHIAKGKGNRKPYRTYATVSKKLADQFQEILQKCGRSASILVQTPPKPGAKLPNGNPVKNAVPLYLVSERKSRCSIIPKPTIIDYNGWVSCVSVPNSVVYTRRNGYAFWSGNTISVDGVVFDEIEEIEDPLLIDLAMERMSHVEQPIVHRLSVPSIPDYGIDAFYELSDQRKWFIKCRKCNTETNLEDEFPNCLIKIASNPTKVIRVCKKCKNEIYPHDGVWRAMKSHVLDKRGYQISQLFSSISRRLVEIHEMLEKGKNLSTLYNDKIGIAYLDAASRLEVQQVLALCGSEYMLDRFDSSTAMGVDQPKIDGGKFHVTISYKQAENVYRAIRITTVEKWEDLDLFMNRYGIYRCVIDGLPDQKKAREFAKRHEGKVFLNYYNDNQKGSYKWNEPEQMVVVNRTESLNASHDDIAEQRLILPRRDEDIEQFAKHCHNVAKKKEEDVDTGSVRYVWVKTGEDHYRHSWNYCAIALSECPIWAPTKEKSWIKKAGQGDTWKTL